MIDDTEVEDVAEVEPAAEPAEPEAPQIPPTKPYAVLADNGQVTQVAMTNGPMDGWVEITAEDYDRLFPAPGRFKLVDGVLESYEPPGPEMAERRQLAFNVAMNYGNTITAQVEGQWANVERASFTAQEMEARDVMAGKALPADAMLPPLAEHKGVTLQDYAQQILANAAAYRQLAIAAVILRRGAEGLMSETLDTPEKLNDAVQALRGQAEAFAKQLGLTIP